MKRRRRVRFELLWDTRLVAVCKVPDQPRILECPFEGQLPPVPPIVREAVMSSGDARRRVEDEGTEADDESEIISVGGPVSVVCGCESEGATFEEAVGRAGLISETETAFDTAGLPIC